jgi:hypothetical protein
MRGVPRRPRLQPVLILAGFRHYVRLVSVFDKVF